MVLNGYCQKDCINGLTKEDAQHVKEIPLIEQTLDGIDSQIGNINGDIADLQAASIRYDDHFDTLDGKVSTLETGLSDLDDWVTEINNTTIANLSTQVNTLQNSTVPGLDARIGTIENSEIPDINDAIDDLDDRVTALESSSTGEWTYITINDLPLTNIICEYIGSPDYIIKFTKDVIINIQTKNTMTRFRFNKNDILNNNEKLFIIHGSRADGAVGSATINLYNDYMLVSDFFRSTYNNFKYTENGYNVFLNDNSQSGYTNYGQTVSIVNKITGNNQVTILYR